MGHEKRGKGRGKLGFQPFSLYSYLLLTTQAKNVEKRDVPGIAVLEHRVDHAPVF
jgi:hypothetical protein